MRGLALALLLAGCVGRIDLPGGSSASGGGSAEGNPQDGWPNFGATTSYQLRRLTNEQYAASVQSLLGVSAAGMPGIEPVAPVAGYAALGASTVVVSSDGVAKFEDAARFLAAAAMASPTSRQKVVPCTPSSVSDTACFSAFVTSFGLRAFRRPLTQAEVDAYVALTASIATDTQDPWQGIESTLTAFLQSPNFLYLPEVGTPDALHPGRFRYTGYELASRLSYFLTNDTPDDALLAAAAAGELDTPEGVQAQTDRLLEKPGAHDALRTFFSAMLSLDGLDGLARPVEVFPSFTPTLAASLKEETLLGLDDLVFARDADFRSAFTESHTFVNGELAAFYGVAAPGGSGFSRVELPAGGRVGLLGEAGVLAVHDHSAGTSPTKRGLFVLTRLLCQKLALAPPANLTIPPPPTGVMTARQRLAQHDQNAVCAGCHQAMDGVGLSLEHLDALGEWREQDQGLAIDDTGKLGGVTWQGEAGLSALVAQHPALEPCLVQALYGASVGHSAQEFDRASFEQLVDQFDAGGARVRSLLRAITASDGFRYAPLPN